MDILIRTVAIFSIIIGALVIGTLLIQPEKLTLRRFKVAALTAIFTTLIVVFLVYALLNIPIGSDLFFKSYLFQILALYIFNPDGKTIPLLTCSKDEPSF